ncbi:MAG: antibiotic biosynthesis monooxygenase [Acidobacteria bacterium]|nr:antibiotic biosynthesis monooxygenase [Acidobacteriota bacterium]
MIAVVWQFQVRRGKQEQFEQLYGADGPWTALSRRSRSFLGTSFLRDQVQTPQYVLIEYWSEMLVYEKHFADYSAEVARLEVQRDELCESILPMGIFTCLDVPDRFGPTWSQRDGV